MMRAVWSEDPVSFPARHIPAVIDDMRMLPQPVKPIPIWIGGSSEAALNRALRLDGWHGSRLSPEALRRSCDVCVKSVRNQNSRFRCAAAGTARTTARSPLGSLPMPKPVSVTFWSSPASARSTTGCAPSSGSPAWRRETYDEIGNDPEVLAHLRRHRVGAVRFAGPDCVIAAPFGLPYEVHVDAGGRRELQGHGQFHLPLPKKEKALPQRTQWTQRTT